MSGWLRSSAGSAAAVLWLLSSSGWGCAKAPPSVVETAEFGVFFGGQLQERKQLPKELDPTRQSHGFRLTFRGPLQQELPVTWEIALPASPKGGPRSAHVGELTVKAGERRLDVPLGFRPSDPLGSWHAKVTAGGEAVIDRDFEVVAGNAPARK